MTEKREVSELVWKFILLIYLPDSCPVSYTYCVWWNCCKLYTFVVTRSFGFCVLDVHTRCLNWWYIFTQILFSMVQLDPFLVCSVLSDSFSTCKESVSRWDQLNSLQISSPFIHHRLLFSSVIWLAQKSKNDTMTDWEAVWGGRKRKRKGVWEGFFYSCDLLGLMTGLLSLRWYSN